jgi:hypothetical protein
VTRTWIIDVVGERTFSRLADELTGSELQSVLLEVMRHRAFRRDPSEILAQYHRDGFVRPAVASQRLYHEIDGHLLAAAASYEALELSPLAPLASCSSIALTDQNRTVSALRATEVVSDPTNVLALDSAERLRAKPDELVQLTTVQRVVRAQPIPKLPGAANHFRIFVLTTAGREQRDHAVAAAALVDHVRTMHRAFDRLEQHGFRFGARRIEVLARPDRASLGDRIAAELGASRGVLDHAYYNGGVRYRYWVTTPSGDEIPIADGGTFDWVARLTANRRNVFVASGMGAQLVATAFR